MASLQAHKCPLTSRHGSPSGPWNNVLRNADGADHVQSTIATAEEAGVLALARLWWRNSWPTPDLAGLVDFEIGQQALYLTKTFNPASEEVLVGVGDQLDASGNLVMYQDFGSADLALQVRHTSGSASGLLGVCRAKHM